MTSNDIDKKRKLYELFNKKIEHEDNLFNARITWFVAVQALLFSPTFLTLKENHFEHKDALILWIISIGLSFCLIVLLSCQAAHCRIKLLIKNYNNATDKYGCKNTDSLIHPQITSPRWIHFLGMLASYGSIVIFSKFWLYLGTITITNVNSIFIHILFAFTIIIDCIVFNQVFSYPIDCVCNPCNENKNYKNCHGVLVLIFHFFLTLFILYIENRIYNNWIDNFIIPWGHILIVSLIIILLLSIILILPYRIKFFIFSNTKYKELNSNGTLKELEDKSFYSFPEKYK